MDGKIRLATAIAAGFLVAAAPAAILTVPATGYAKSENAGGKSDKGGRGAERSAERSGGGKSTGASSKSGGAKAYAYGKTKEKKVKEQKVAIVPKEKNLNAKMGALNAAHANARALENAAPNSRVGMIATYKEQALEAFAAGAELDAAEQALVDAGFTEEQIAAYAGYDSYDDYVADRTLDRDTLVDAQVGLDPTSDEYVALQDAIDAIDEELELAEANQDGLDDYVEAAGLYETEAGEARAALENAANKPIADEDYEEIAAEVDRLLGIGVE